MHKVECGYGCSLMRHVTCPFRHVCTCPFRHVLGTVRKKGDTKPCRGPLLCAYVVCICDICYLTVKAAEGLCRGHMSRASVVCIPAPQMCSHIYRCVCVYVYICKHISIYKYTHIYMSGLCVCVCVCVCVCRVETGILDPQRY